jgi:hypothetical protein
MARMVTITVSGSVHQKRRWKSISSLLSSSSSGITDSSVMPQIGAIAGMVLRTSGCMGQV